jgi:hypothetical protein
MRIGEIMKRTRSPATPATLHAVHPHEVLNRIKLEFLDEFACEKRGYDPYDTSTAGKPDIWAAKRKRA